MSVQRKQKLRKRAEKQKRRPPPEHAQRHRHNPSAADPNAMPPICPGCAMPQVRAQCRGCGGYEWLCGKDPLPSNWRRVEASELKPVAQLTGDDFTDFVSEGTSP